MNTLIVHAHPEPHSFNAALTTAATEALTAAGHSVVVSDLYRMGYNPVSDRRNFTTITNSEFFNQQQEELHAVAHNGFAFDVAAELEKVRQADLLIFQFPLWWFHLPAILKGWVDKTFAMGAAYGYGKLYNRGVFAGKRAMISLTTGGPAGAYSPNGMYGHINQLLFPIHYGIFAFTGFTVLPPFCAFGVHRITQEARTRFLADYRQRLLNLDTLEPLNFPHIDEFDPKTFERRNEN